MLLSLKSMTTTLRNSAPPFDALVALHFTAASSRILARCASLLRLKGTLERAALGGGGKAAVAPAPASDDSPAAAPDTNGAAESGPEGGDAVAAAGLKGVLNAKPTLGFLHSLDRMVPPLRAAFEGAQQAGSSSA
mmetsp:Transcript_16345/g.51729  ORF Transcript_16345/g.51729 Transcript_16345/m.51729 type:complete len:135 (+) Transcript_16345:661-1065(+)